MTLTNKCATGWLTAEDIEKFGGLSVCHFLKACPVLGAGLFLFLNFQVEESICNLTFCQLTIFENTNWRCYRVFPGLRRPDVPVGLSSPWGELRWIKTRSEDPALTPLFQSTMKGLLLTCDQVGAMRLALKEVDQPDALTSRMNTPGDATQAVGGGSCRRVWGRVQMRCK